MIRIVEGIPGVPHKWAKEIKHWADGGLVQACYNESGIPAHLMLKPEHRQWMDCPYPNAGAPNWFNDDLEFRIAPEPSP